MKNKSLFLFFSFLIGGALGSWAGADGTSKNWRRIGLSLISVVMMYIFSKSIWSLIFVLLMVDFGYGVPDSKYGLDPNADSGSMIGRFWWRITKGNMFLVDIMTRFTVSLYKVLICLVVPINSGVWTVYFLFSFCILSVSILFGGNSIIKNEGEFELFGKKLLWEEFIINGSNLFCISSMIFLSFTV